ncbi:MAG: 4Fe-4S binding protein [Bacteroidales bacterium]|nr:4Fe-4S binding protein [Candidatus Latescibacterota bacterium]
MSERDVEKNIDLICIDDSKCIVCGACVAVCPTEALIIEGLTLKSVPERCRPCGQAALVCPTGALRCPQKGEKSKNG